MLRDLSSLSLFYLSAHCFRPSFSASQHPKSPSTARIRRAALLPVLSTDSPCVFASQDAEWVEEEPDAETNSGASEPRSRCEKQNCGDHTSSLFFVCLFSFKVRLLWLHIATSVLFSAALRLALDLSCPSVAEVTAT